MAIQSDDTALSKGDLKAYHERILPYLGGNMMMQTAVSDYYSTDEKIVGVWTNGKPVYQKVINFTTPSTANTETSIVKVANGADSNLVDLEIYVYGGTYTIPMFCHPTASNFVYGFLSNSYLCVNVAAPYINKSAMAIIKYTKTTDTATTALTTPGAYDLNRPDLWPANKEIFFGNGLYGYRTAGNCTNTSSGEALSIPIINAVISPINQGGWIDVIKNGTSKRRRSWSTCTATLTDGIMLTGGIHSSFDGNTSNFFALIGSTSSLNTTCKYDLWVLYTK